MGNKLNLAVIFGGCSGEYEVSLKSAAAVISNLDKSKYTVHQLGITRTGEWLLYTGRSEHIADGTWPTQGCTPAHISPCRSVQGITTGDRTIRLDAALPILHGKYGEDGTVQGLLELAGIPVIGCDTLSSALCMDKQLAHTVAAAKGIAAPTGFTVPAGCDMHTVHTKAGQLGFPLFVKPLKGGSSLGVSCIYDQRQLAGGVTNALQYDSAAIIEQRIEGVEVGCAIIGEDILTIGEVDEIEIAGDCFDYTEKYNPITSIIHMPARIDDDTAERIKDTAARIYRALGCSGFARVDMFLTPEGGIVFNEVNTIPGFTAHSRFPNMLKGIGYTFPAILDEIILQAMATNHEEAV